MERFGDLLVAPAVGCIKFFFFLVTFVVPIQVAIQTGAEGCICSGIA